MKLTYTNVNGYLIPDLTYKSGEQMEQLGKYGFLRKDYLKNHQPKMLEYAQPCKGLDTGDNNRFLRNWFEVELSKIGRGNVWIPYNKGGGYRKWYGLNDYVILYETV